MTDSFAILIATAAFVGLVHTVLGPDHYLPFVALARARRWSMATTMAVTALCGLGHVLSSAALGLVGIACGAAVFHLARIESARGSIVAWLMLGFGLAYGAWGIRRATRRESHTHAHVHADRTVHAHAHRHLVDRVHPHVPPCEEAGPRGMACVDAASRGARSPSARLAPGGRPGEGGADGDGSLTPWVLFIVFIFGPCEPLIPLLMYPAATGSLWHVAAVVAVFAAATLATMLGVVFAAQRIAPRMRWPALARYEHALAGLVVAACGAGLVAGF